MRKFDAHRTASGKKKKKTVALVTTLGRITPPLPPRTIFQSLGH